MSNFEKKFGRFAIKNLSLYLIICYAFGYILELVNSSFLHYLTLNPYFIMRGQIWRLISWILVPPESSNIIFVLIMLYFYYSIGTTLERTWGTYRYNVYIFGGMLCTVVGAFCLYFYWECGYDFGLFTNLNNMVSNWSEISKLTDGTVSTTSIYSYIDSALGFSLFSTYYINMSIFLAYASTYPDMHVLLLFVIPIKVKWLGIIYAVLMVFDLFQYYAAYGMGYAIVLGFVMLSSMANFLIFFFFVRKKVHRTREQILHQHMYRSEVKHAEAKTGTTRQGPFGNNSGKITRHKCAVCGKTEKDDPDMQFRFCSRCNGNYEYCDEHLWTHTHIQ